LTNAAADDLLTSLQITRIRPRAEEFEEFEEGMTLEPLLVGSPSSSRDGVSAPPACQNGFGYRTADGAPSAHFERTLVMTSAGCKSLHTDLA
jgi:hypothetical protein